VTATAEPHAAALARLAEPALELAEVMRLVAELEPAVPADRTVKLGVSSNVTVELLHPFLRRQALLHGRRAVVHAGNYDDHLGSVRRFVEEGLDGIVLLTFFDNLLPGLEARFATLSPEMVAAQRDRVVGELRLALEAARDVKWVFLGLLHTAAQPSPARLDLPAAAAVAEINAALIAEAARHPNVRLFSPAEIVAQLGWRKAIDVRFHHRFRAPWTAPFLDEVARQLFRLSRGFGSYYYKALVVDADNTLWGGIIGEDGLAGIKLAAHKSPGSIFWTVQQELLALQRRGVLLCLCSKNEAADVDAVLATHPEAVLRAEHFAARQVNWDDKPTNLKRLAATLNLGLESFVFLDDSDFECAAVRSQLPMVRTFQVPANPHDYPALVHELKELFLAGGISADGASKTEQYRIKAAAEAERATFANEQEYLASLGLTVTIRRNDASSVARIAELTQKSNQFNVTTRRYTEVELRALMEGGGADVFSIHVADRFGDAGLTGVAILRYRDEEASIDSFLLSCRILGRGVERAPWHGILERARARRCRVLSAEYLPTPKNAQVREYFDNLGLAIDAEAGTVRRYRAALDLLVIEQPAHIEVIHVG
jgi:FkbH-like protein